MFEKAHEVKKSVKFPKYCNGKLLQISTRELTILYRRARRSEKASKGKRFGKTTEHRGRGRKVVSEWINSPQCPPLHPLVRSTAAFASIPVGFMPEISCCSSHSLFVVIISVLSWLPFSLSVSCVQLRPFFFVIRGKEVGNSAIRVSDGLVGELSDPEPANMLSRSQDPSLDLDERLRILYPMVNEADTPLPRDVFTLRRSWNKAQRLNISFTNQWKLRALPPLSRHGKGSLSGAEIGWPFICNWIACLFSLVQPHYKSKIS